MLLVNTTRTQLNDTICALATPAGTGAIGVIRVSGQQAIQHTANLFHGKDLMKVESHTVHFGTLRLNGELLDEVLVAVFIGPKSYSGEHTTEISCHGSPYIQQRILEALVQTGCRMAQPGEFTLRAFLNRKLDLSQAEAVADLIASDSEKSHKTAMNQMRGGFSREIASLKEQLVNFASLIELELDFSEEDVEFASRPELRELVNRLLSVINQLTETFRMGNAIRNGVPTVIAGRPNAGKSTLLNALLNDERAIVSPIAGTTRDTIEEAFNIGGIIFRLIDTAGIREHTADLIERIGIEKTYDRIRQASIVIYLFDAGTMTSEEVAKDLQAFHDLDAVVVPVANKSDLLSSEEITEKYASIENIISLSSKEKSGLDQLRERLLQVVENDKINNDVIITNLRHYQALNHAAESLMQVLSGMESGITGELLAFDIRKALFHLGEIVGDVTTDDLLANIFSRFCIGK